MKKVAVTYIRETWDGLLIKNGVEAMWLPLSFIKGFEANIHKEGEEISIFIPDHWD